MTATRTWLCGASAPRLASRAGPAAAMAVIWVVTRRKRRRGQFDGAVCLSMADESNCCIVNLCLTPARSRRHMCEHTLRRLIRPAEHFAAPPGEDADRSEWRI